MSRGPGIWQRAILDNLKKNDAVVITHPDFSHAEQNALRRAAYKLEATGKINLTSQRVAGRPRLVAYRAGMNVQPPHLCTGMDGKMYRQPAR